MKLGYVFINLIFIIIVILRCRKFYLWIYSEVFCTHFPEIQICFLKIYFNRAQYSRCLLRCYSWLKELCTYCAMLADLRVYCQLVCWTIYCRLIHYDYKYDRYSFRSCLLASPILRLYPSKFSYYSMYLDAYFLPLKPKYQ